MGTRKEIGIKNRFDERTNNKHLTYSRLSLIRWLTEILHNIYTNKYIYIKIIQLPLTYLNWQLFEVLGYSKQFSFPLRKLSLG